MPVSDKAVPNQYLTQYTSIHTSMAPEKLYPRKGHLLPERVHEHTGVGLFTRLVSYPQKRGQSLREKNIKQVYFDDRVENRKVRRMGSQCRALCMALENKTQRKREQQQEWASWRRADPLQSVTHMIT